MVASFSPHRDTGGTLHLPSPSGLHHDHASSALNQLRRSLSRSPSKGSDYRPFSPSRLHSPSAKKAHFSSSLSPSRRSSQQHQGDNIFFVPATNGSSTVPISYLSSSKVQRPSMRRNTSFQSPRARTNPSSPAKRVLSDSRDQGNAATPPRQLAERGGIDDENKQNSPPLSTLESTHTEKNADGGTTAMECVEGGSLAKPGPSRVEKRRSGNFGPFLTSSPLKRSDGIMNLDQVGSPSAKRRSLHGAASTPEFDIFDCQMGNATSTDAPTSANTENDPPPSIFSHPPGHFSTVPKRSSSLRKSTLQQRQQIERPLFGRSKSHADSDAESPTGSPMAGRSRQRMSLDNNLFLSPSPDNATSNGAVPKSTTPFFPSRQNTNGQTQQPAHPLSRTITQSSSGSSFVDDSPTHEPVKVQDDGPKPILNFSKSLPAGSSRPLGPSQLRNDTSHNDPDPNFATPESYKFAKPLPAAFMSTGLISKKNRDAADIHNSSMMSKNMPDTPCKRTANLFPVRKTPHQSNTNAKPAHTPSQSWTPLKHPPTAENGTPFVKGMGIFGSSFAKRPLSRRSSFVSVDGDDQSQSPSTKPNAQFAIDSDLPPTPTKQASLPYDNHAPRSQFHNSQKSPFDFLSGPEGPNCKLPFVGDSPSDSDDESDNITDDFPSANPSHKYSRHKLSLSSIPRSHPLQNFMSPSPQPNGFSKPNFPSTSSHQSRNAKSSTASPLNGKSTVHASPHTPQEHIFPPDPSGLSISAHNDRGSNLIDPHASALPATPTGPREYFPHLGKRHSLPLSGYSAPDVDPSLTSRFDKVELVGTGEFSQVYRVTERQSTTPFTSPFCSSAQTQSSNVRQERVWAVKKAKQPYSGLKDRERRNNEVEVLKALGTSDYVISFANSWERHSHLYIQTEFCEEGSLDVFLSQVGLKARLDDFRIWKILLELSLGLKHIHDSGFIHLDLKPANVLITFEGVLKIADFGMATRWPAPAGIEGEGDREYIGPEVLMGRFDKPADIFSLGLIIFEIAGNVELPDNGISWQKLRNGDMSDVPSLTWSCETSNVLRDASGNPLPSNWSFDQLCDSDADGTSQPDGNKNLSGIVRSGELEEPPSFMVDANSDQALDKLVGWMISPLPSDRPRTDDIISSFGVQWAERRRRAGATIYEGNWGPADEILAEDAEMIDV